MIVESILSGHAKSSSLFGSLPVSIAEKITRYIPISSILHEAKQKYYEASECIGHLHVVRVFHEERPHYRYHIEKYERMLQDYHEKFVYDDEFLHIEDSVFKVTEQKDQRKAKLIKYRAPKRKNTHRGRKRNRFVNWVSIYRGGWDAVQYF
jgi:hypothetical protein